MLSGPGFILGKYPGKKTRFFTQEAGENVTGLSLRIYTPPNRFLVWVQTRWIWGA